MGAERGRKQVGGFSRHGKRSRYGARREGEGGAWRVNKNAGQRVTPQVGAEYFRPWRSSGTTWMMRFGRQGASNLPWG